MIHIILVAPEIPPNTGNIIRLAANTGAALHLVKPLGFRMDDRDLKRAGMDYRERAVFRVHDDFPAALAAARGENPGARVFAVSPAGTVRHDAPRYRAGDIFVFGRESDGLPPDILSGFPPEKDFANPDASRQPQHKPLQRRRRRRNGSMAPTQLRRIRIVLN